MTALRNRIYFLVSILILGFTYFAWINYDSVQYWRQVDAENKSAPSPPSPPQEHKPPPPQNQITPPQEHAAPTSGTNGGQSHNLPPTSSEETKESPLKKPWVDVAVTTSVGAQWDPKPIQELCNKTKVWSSDVIFECRDSQGGIGNVRQDILACVRYAIDAGAGLLMPDIIVRGDDLADLKHGDKMQMEYMFNRELFVERITESCPQMKLYDSQAALEKLGPVVGITLAPRDIQGEGNDTILTVNEELSKNRAPIGSMTLVRFLITLAYYPICRDNEAFANQLGNLLLYREDTRLLAASALFELHSRYNLGLDPASAISPKGYLGAHLRTAADAVAAGWPDYYAQRDHYLKIASEELLPVIYVASGNLSSVEMLAHSADALRPSIPVVTKMDLLSTSEKEQLSKLTWDQQALVDFLIMEKASFFCGLAESSFSWNVVVRRRVGTESGTCGDRVGRPSFEGIQHGSEKKYDNVTEIYRDGLSSLIGAKTSEWETTMWP